MKRFLAIMAMALALAVPTVALAFSATSESNVNLPKGETKAGTYYATGKVVTIDGDVNGDLVCGGQTVVVNGAIHGDLICAAQTITVSGPVDGSVRVAGQTVDLNGTVGRNVTALAQTLNLGSGAHVAGDLGVAGQTVTINGPVDKDVYGYMESLTIASTVGAVSAQVNSLSLASGAKVNGNVDYTSPTTSDIDKSKVGGTVNYTVAPERNHPNVAAAAAKVGFALRLYWIFAALVLGLALAALAPRMVDRVTRVMIERPGASIGWGLIVALLAPILAFILLFTIIGVPIALLLFVLWGLALALSGVFAGIAAGRWLLDRADWRSKSLIWSAALGVPITIIVISVPFLGGIVGLVASWWAVGGLSLNAKSLRR